MCGIYGLISWSGVSAEDVLKKCNVMIHRGPDDSGIWINKNKTVALAHRRLSIIDLSEKGRQPFISDDGRYVIIYNGEIYNYREIRVELENKYKFRSSSDTEVILMAFRE